jgi:hypothetical protein
MAKIQGSPSCSNQDACRLSSITGNPSCSATQACLEAKLVGDPVCSGDFGCRQATITGTPVCTGNNACLDAIITAATTTLATTTQAPTTQAPTTQGPTTVAPIVLTCTGDATSGGSCAGVDLSQFVGDLICQDNRSCMGLTIGSAGYVPKSIMCKASMSCSVRCTFFLNLTDSHLISPN